MFSLYPKPFSEPIRHRELAADYRCPAPLNEALIGPLIGDTLCAVTVMGETLLADEMLTRPIALPRAVREDAVGGRTGRAG